MQAPHTRDIPALDAIERRYGSIADSADAKHARELKKNRRETSTEQPEDKPSLHRRRSRRHVQMIAIEAPRAGEFRKDDPAQLLYRGIATKTSHVHGKHAFRPIQKERDRFKREAIRSLKQQIETA